VKTFEQRSPRYQRNANRIDNALANFFERVFTAFGVVWAILLGVMLAAFLVYVAQQLLLP
jgi:hypothetical protein